MAWCFYLAQFVSGLFLANGVPHFVQGISGQRFQSPFASPRGVGESSPVVNVLWGFANIAVGFAFLRSFELQGPEEVAGWITVGVLSAGLLLSRHFGRVRGNLG